MLYPPLPLLGTVAKVVWQPTKLHFSLKIERSDAALEIPGSDKNCPLSYEPSGSDFLSPCIQVYIMLPSLALTHDHIIQTDCLFINIKKCCLQKDMAMIGISTGSWSDGKGAGRWCGFQVFFPLSSYRLCSKICGFLVLYLWKSSLYLHIHRWKINNIWENLVPKKRTRFLFLAYVNEICWWVNNIGGLQ